MSDTQDLPAWLKGITRARPTVALLLHAMIVHGIRHGHVTAEDVHHIPVDNPNVRGASAKYLRSCGFVADRLLTGTTKKSHGHFLHRWLLKDYPRARAILDKLASDLCLIGEKGQMNLL